jgi:hypothetical protein
MATCTRARETTQINAIFGQKKKEKEKKKAFGSWQGPLQSEKLRNMRTSFNGLNG